MRRSPLQLSILSLLLALSVPLSAGEIDMRDYNLLRRGMSEAEVLYRIGPPDHETVYNDYHGIVQRKIWYYIPDGRKSRQWISTITFDSHGIVTELRRERP